MPFADIASEVSGNLPGVSPILVETWVKRAWRQIRDKRLWSFLTTDDSVVCPAAITVGTVNITQFSNTVVADATASAAIAAIGNLIETPFQFLSFRFGQGTTSQIYNIVSVDQTVPTALVFTLNRVVVEATNAAQVYICYRPYVAAPVSDFLRWISFVDMVNGWQLAGDYSSALFDKMDPQRQSFGQAYNVGYFKDSDDNPSNQAPVPMYELWPGPTDGQTFYVRYRRQGADFSAPGDTQPQIIPDQLIVQFALTYYAYPWARVNAGHFAAYSKVNWSQAITDGMRIIHGQPGVVGILQDAMRQDDNQTVQSVIRRGHGLRSRRGGFPYPIDANFIQSHLVPL